MTEETDSGASAEARAPAAAAVLRAAALGECPRCGSRTLFKGLVDFAARCGNCGLDYSRFNVGDGPAAFLTLVIGTILAIAAIVLDQSVHPPFWVHIILWVPLTAVMVFYGLRVAKGALLILEYHRGAREAGSLETDGTRRERDDSED